MVSTTSWWVEQLYYKQHANRNSSKGGKVSRYSTESWSILILILTLLIWRRGKSLLFAITADNNICYSTSPPPSIYNWHQRAMTNTFVPLLLYYCQWIGFNIYTLCIMAVGTVPDFHTDSHCLKPNCSLGQYSLLSRCTNDITHKLIYVSIC